MVEHLLAKEKVAGSIPVSRSRFVEVEVVTLTHALDERNYPTGQARLQSTHGIDRANTVM